MPIRPLLMSIALLLLCLSHAVAAPDEIVNPAANIVEESARSITVVVWVVVIGVGLLAGIFLMLKIMKEVGGMQSAKDPTTAAIDAALKAEKKGDHLKAAMNYEVLGDHAKAAPNFERARDFAKAAHHYESAGQYDRAIANYKKAGNASKVGALFLKTGKYADAARLFKSKGDSYRAAQAFEKMGNKLAAAREYSEARQYLHAAKMYKDERMYREASQMYYRYLQNEPIHEQNLDKYYTYAAFLMMCEELDEAYAVYEQIVEVDRGFRDAAAKHKLIGIRIGKIEPEPEEVVEAITEEQPAAAQAAPSVIEAPDDKALQQTEVDDLFESLSARHLEQEQFHAEQEIAKAEAATQADTAHTDTAQADSAPAASAHVAHAEPAPVPQPRMEEKAAQPKQATVPEPASPAKTEAQQKPEHSRPAAPVNSLRAMIDSGPIEPRQAMRIWMQLLKRLHEKHGSGTHLGCIPPESIIMDGGNIRIEPTKRHVAEYTAPEIQSDAVTPDGQTDVYVMGVILYEMIAGSLDEFGRKYPIDLAPGVPEWMDMMIMKCVERDRGLRYRDVDEVAAFVMAKAASGG